jgi:hypothetical protein
VLKPGGRVAVSDVALKKPLPPEVGPDLLAYVGCIAGALPIAEYVEGLRAAGFSAVEVVDTKRDLNAYSQVEVPGACRAPTTHAGPAAAASGCCTPAPAGQTVHGGLAELLKKHDVNEFAASVRVYALKGA